jgi:hypothetical protein
VFCFSLWMRSSDGHVETVLPYHGSLTISTSQGLETSPGSSLLLSFLSIPILENSISLSTVTREIGMQVLVLAFVVALKKFS